MLVGPVRQWEIWTKSGQRELASSDIQTSTTALRHKQPFHNRSFRELNPRQRLGRVLKQPTARVPGSHWIFAKRAIPVGTEHLQRLMHNVPTEDPLRSSTATRPTVCPGVG
jgi:hypothetical protein